MPEPYGYTGGTITLTSGSTAVTGALTAWADLLPGDEIERGGVRGVVDVVVSNTSLTLRAAWGGATYTGTDYVALYRSSSRHDVSRLSERYARWHRDAAYVINTTGIPDNAVGQDGWMAIDSAAGVSYTKTAGVWGGATTMRLRVLGAYSGATAYLAGDVVTHQSAGWVARIDTTGVAPPTLPTETNTQWQLIGKSGDLTRLDAVAGGDVAAWTGTNSAQIRKATAAEVRTAAGSIREPLTAARTYYVRTDGNNANDGLTNTSGGAKLTIAGALAAAYTIDARGQSVTISIGAGTFAENISVDAIIPGINRLYFIGAGENSTIVGSNAGTACLFNVPMRYQIHSLTLGHASGGNSVGLWGRYGSTIYTAGGTLGFNALTARAIGLDTGASIESTSGEIRLRGNTPYVFYVSSGANGLTTAGCTIKTMAAITVTAFASVFDAAAIKLTATYDVTGGAVTGSRYSVATNGVLSTNGGGASFLPGSTAGTTATGGQYV